MRIVQCKVNHLTNPLGYKLDTPVFSYKVTEAKGKKQTEARIVVTKDIEGTQILADTGRKKEISPLGYAISFELEPCTRYYWTVTVWSDAEEEAVSEVNWFETGKLKQAWSGKWISCKNTTERHPIFQKVFAKEAKKIRQARLYICGLGLYEASINGRPVTNERFVPFCNDYSSWTQYQTYDVTSFIEETNQLSVLVGDGWYKGRFGFSSRPGDKGYYGEDYRLIAELHIVYEDGSNQMIVTDDTWTVSGSNLTFSSIYDGEHRDDTLEEQTPENVFCIEESLPLTERLSIPVLEQEEFPAKELLHTPAGEWVYDIGQNIAGGFRLYVCEPKGTVVRVQFGEVLQQGNFYRDNLRTAKAEYVYVSDGKEHIIEPHFTYYGYRYAKVEGIAEPKPEHFTSVAYYSDIKETGTIETDDALLNQLISNIRWGQKGNFLDVPTDCPQRDERMGWTADTQVFVPTAAYFTDSMAFYRKYLYDLRMEQKKRDGLVPNVIPAFGENGTASVWGDAATLIPWYLYLFYGDRTILEESYESMKDWVSYIGRVDGEDHGWRKVFHFGDWLALDHPAGGAQQTAGGTEEAYIADIYYWNSVYILKNSAEILQKQQDVEYYQALSERLWDGIQEEYFTRSGRCAIQTQTGYALALYYGLTNNPQKVLSALLTLLKHHEYKLKTGFVGTPLICKALSNAGCDALAYDIVHNEEYPGWLYEIKLGATTVWERWNSMNADGSVSSTGMNSFNHYAYGAIAEWMWRTMAGLHPLEEKPGFEKVLLKPVPDYKTGACRAVYDSPAGIYKVEWKVEDLTHVSVKIEVPFNCEAVLELPWAKAMEPVVLEAGSYEYALETKEPLKKIMTVDDTIATLLDNPKSANLLTRFMPQIKDVPTRMRQATLRMALSRNPQMAEKIEIINQMLMNL